MLPKRLQHTRVGIASISSPNTPCNETIHSKSSVRPHSCYGPKILQAKCNRKHRNLALCEPPTSGNPTSEMEGRELICRATGSAIPRSDLAHASQGPQWLNHPLVKQGTCGLCTSLQGLYKVDSSNAHPQQLGSTTSTNQTELLQVPEFSTSRNPSIRFWPVVVCSAFTSCTSIPTVPTPSTPSLLSSIVQLRARSPHSIAQSHPSDPETSSFCNQPGCSRAPYWQRVLSSPRSRTMLWP
jgi:hypothetical protein